MLVNIQFLRCVAAMMVVIYHASARMPSNEGPASWFFQAGTATGFAGVDVFFVISGFIMAWTTFEKSGAPDGSDFARRRVARIYSGYWPFFVLAAIIFAWARSTHFADSNLLKSFFLWPQPLNHNLLEVTWTLSFELYFYALFALLIWVMKPAQRLWVCWSVLLAVIGFNAWREFVLDSFGPDHLYALGFWDQFLTSPFLAQFFAGAILAYGLRRKPNGLAWTWLLMGIGLFATAGIVNQVLYEGRIEQGFFVVPRVALFGVASVMIVAGLVRLENRGTRAPARFSLLTGGASYAIYLSHVPIIVAVHQLGFGQWASNLPYPATALAYLALVGAILGISVAHYRFFERRLHGVFRRALGVR